MCDEEVESEDGSLNSDVREIFSSKGPAEAAEYDGSDYSDLESEVNKEIGGTNFDGADFEINGGGDLNLRKDQESGELKSYCLSEESVSCAKSVECWE